MKSLQRAIDFQLKIQYSSAFFKSQKAILEGNQPSSYTFFSPNIPNQNFETAILSKTDQRENNKPPGLTYLSTAPGARAVSYTSYQLLTYKVFMEEVVVSNLEAAHSI